MDIETAQKFLIVDMETEQRLDRGHHRSQSLIGKHCSVSESAIGKRCSVSMSVTWKRFSISMSIIWKCCSIFKELQHKFFFCFFAFFFYLGDMNKNFNYYSEFRKHCITIYEKLADWFRIPLKT